MNWALQMKNIFLRPLYKNIDQLIQSSVEKLRNNSPNIFTHSHYLTEKDKGQKIINFENLALYNLVQKN